MKFYELTALLKRHIADFKKNNPENPALPYIISSYNKLIKTLYDAYSDNEMVTDKKINILQITDHMKEKILKIIDKGLTKKLAAEFEKSRKEEKLKRDLDELLGIGSKKISELIAAGLKDIKQLHSRKWFNMLNADTQAVITHKPDRQIPYEDIKKIEHLLTAGYNGVAIVGSYRRKKPIIRDIDILFMQRTSQDLRNYILRLQKAFRDNVWLYSNGTNKTSFIFQPDPSKETKYKGDIFITTPDTFYSTLLYATGSQAHNIKMRKQAKSMGLLLNQNGLFQNGKKINSPMDTEEKLFSLLNMKYAEPEKRF